jgi:hypothetical protein
VQVPNGAKFITLVGGAAAWPLAAGAGKAATPLVGLLSGGSSNYPALTRALLRAVTLKKFPPAAVSRFNSTAATEDCPNRLFALIRDHERPKRVCVIALISI